MAINQNHIVMAFTGASGAPYGLRLLECLIRADCQVDIIFSKAAHMVFAMETDLELPSRPAELADALSKLNNARAGQLRVFGREDWTSPLASGSHTAGSMVVCPCTMGTLAAIANGLSDNLIERAADVMIKENRKLVLVPRETPLSVIHLENMKKLAQAGVSVLPANPGFYYRPQSLSDLVDFVVARILDQIHVEHELIDRWGEEHS